MYGKMHSACLYGIEGVMIGVEIDLANGLPQTNIIGLPDSAIREAVERVRAAVKNCGYRYPQQRITINLAPADLRKEGSAFDLAIALGILITSGQLILPSANEVLFIGELALDGSLRPVSGVLPMVEAARKNGFKAVLLPEGNAAEAALISGINIYAIDHLCALPNPEESPSNSAMGIRGRTNRINWMGGVSEEKTSLLFLPFPVSVTKGKDANERPPVLVLSLEHLKYTPVNGTSAASSCAMNDMMDDYSDVLGQQHVKRALTIAAAGMHNILLIGPPGTGKTMLIKRLPSILPKLSESEALEVTKIFSAAGTLKDADNGLLRSRPFRSPIIRYLPQALLGVEAFQSREKLVLHIEGILFLDELPEFSRNVLEVLRQPLEDGVVTISRARASFTYPAKFMLAASMNPCSCGYFGSGLSQQHCTCSPARIAQYRAKISGPLLDRIDLQVDVPRPKEWDRQGHVLSSAEMYAEVMAAQAIQAKRFKRLPISWNSELSGASLRRYASLSREGAQLLYDILENLGLSMRAHDRIIKLSRTIADLEGAQDITSSHLAEAVQYRNLDRQAMTEE